MSYWVEIQENACWVSVDGHHLMVLAINLSINGYSWVFESEKEALKKAKEYMKAVEDYHKPQKEYISTVDSQGNVDIMDIGDLGK